MKVYVVRYRGWILGFGHGPEKCFLNPQDVKRFNNYSAPAERKLAAERIFCTAFGVEPEGLPTYFNPSRLTIRQVSSEGYREQFQKLQKSKREMRLAV